MTNNSGIDFNVGDKFVIIDKKILPIFQFEQRAPEVNGKQVKSLTELLYEKSLIHSLNQSSTSILSLLGLSQRKLVLSWIFIVLVAASAILFSIFVLKSVLLSIIAILTAIIVVSAIINHYVLERDLAEWRQNRKSKGPSYIEPELFSKALLEVIQVNLENKFQKFDDTDVVSKLETIKFYSPAISRLIQIAESLKLEQDGTKLSNFKDKLEKLFEEAQKRSSGVYKRNAKGLSFVLGLFLAMVANAEAFYIVGNLSKDNNSFRERVINELGKKESQLFPDQSQQNTQDGFNENKENLIRQILDDVGTLPLGWNFDQELETKNLNSLIKILDENTCSTTDKVNDENAVTCFTEFLDKIEENPHLEIYFQPVKTTKSSQDTKAKVKQYFISHLDRVEKCLELENPELDKCLQAYDFTSLKNYYSENKNKVNSSNQELIESLKPVESCLEPENPEIGACLQNKKYDFTSLKNYYSENKDKVNSSNQELIESLKPVKSCLKPENPEIGACVQADFPTTYRQYHKHLKNQQLSQRIDNIQIPNQTNFSTQINAQINKQGGWFKVIGGWLVSAIAIAMGAPFWFDLLDKLMNVRNAGKPLEKSKQTNKTN